MEVELAALEAVLGHTFRNRGLLERALTHKSRVYEKPMGQEGAGDNEQLEFLGDAILGFVVSEYLYLHHPSSAEGRLSKIKAHLVSAVRLHESAMGIGLGVHLLLGRGEELSGGREKRTLLADGVEALIAALYLDGGLAPAKRFIMNCIVGSLEVPEEGLDQAITDYKSALQETAQSLKLPQPRYVIVAEDGPEHAKTFTVEVRLGKEWSSQAKGLSKKAAGQMAAQQILQQLSSQGNNA
jgi:ribonuclease III